MSTMNISLPDALRSFVDKQVSRDGCGTGSESVRELIRKDQDRLQLRGLLLAGNAPRPPKLPIAAWINPPKKEPAQKATAQTSTPN